MISKNINLFIVLQTCIELGGLLSKYVQTMLKSVPMRVDVCRCVPMRADGRCGYY